MESPAAGQLAILRTHVWSAGLQYYDFLQSVRFGREGWGMMTQGDGQAIKVEAKFRYSVQEPGRLHLEFFDTSSCYSPQDLAFERTEENASRYVLFDVIPGPHQASCQTMAGMTTRGFPWLLRFHSEPFPIGYEPSETLLDYYGRPLRADEMA
jgi:hypothetical protein